MDVQLVAFVRHTEQYDALFRFYHEQLGLAVREQWDEPGNRGAVLMWPGGNACIEVLQMAGIPIPGGQPLNAALSIEVRDVDGLHADLRARGVIIARGLEDAAWGHRSFGIDDPDGLRLWFYQDMNPA